MTGQTFAHQFYIRNVPKYKSGFFLAHAILLLFLAISPHGLQTLAICNCICICKCCVCIFLWCEPFYKKL